MIATRNYRKDSIRFDVPGKATRILHIVLIAMVLIVLRLWYLSVIQYDARVQQAQAPTRRIVIEPSRRATIRDRFGLPMAINKVQYNAAVQYSEIALIPSVGYEIDASGKRLRKYKRKEHIRGLAELLAVELNLDADELEDRIHAEAAFYDHVPYVVKKDIGEAEYYRLKMLEASWAGLQAQRLPKRDYPYGKVGSDVVGYMGAIDAKTYQAIIHQRKTLQAYVRAREVGEEPPLPDGMDSPEEVREHLRDIEERAYAITDFVGKGGIERQFEEDLRGYHGKKRYYVDARGHYLRELPGSRPPIPGQGFTLALSIELQEYAEQLLAQNETLRTTRVHKPYRDAEEETPQHEPWIKGGAIVALDPNNGDVLALASFPRFDPNDFIPSGDDVIDVTKRANVRRWFETESYIGEMWDGCRPLSREVFNASGFSEEVVSLTWERYLNLTFYPHGEVVAGLSAIRTVAGAAALQSATERLVALSGDGDLTYLMNLLYQENGHRSQKCPLPAAERERIETNLNINIEEVDALKRMMDPFLLGVKHNYDKVLLVDLCRIVVDGRRFSPHLLKSVGGQSLAHYRQFNQAAIAVKEVVYQMTKEQFHTVTFREWRQKNEKEFLKIKRREEKLSGRYARPYTEYLDAMEQELFGAFWLENAESLILSFLRGCRANEDIYREQLSTWYREVCKGAHGGVPWRENYLLLQSTLQGLDDSLATEYLRTMRSFKELQRPLLGRYRQLKYEGGVQLEKHLASAFYPTYGFSYGRSLAYRQATPQGSLFKLVTAYEALAQRYRSIGGGEDILKLNPLRMVDQPLRIGGDWIVGYHMDGKGIPEYYKGGILPKTLTKNVGEIDIVRAIEVSSNSYFALLTSDHMARPRDLTDAAHALSYGHRTGIALPGEITGKVPTDLDYNRSGLYSLAIGQHSLVVSPLQTAVMLATLANGGAVLQPKIVSQIGGNVNSRYLLGRHDNEYRESLLVAGIDFPLFLGSSQRRRQQAAVDVPTVIHRKLLLPSPVRSFILEGMYRVANRYQTRALGQLREVYHSHPEAIQAVVELKDQMVGKTSTAESVENFGPDRHIGTLTYNHVWFGSVVFDREGNGGQEIVFHDRYGQPELIVIVYLRYGASGRDAVPLAAQIATKWRALRNR